MTYGQHRDHDRFGQGPWATQDMFRVIDCGGYGTPVRRELVEFFNSAIDQLEEKFLKYELEFYCGGIYAAHCASIKSKET